MNLVGFCSVGHFYHWKCVDIMLENEGAVELMKVCLRRELEEEVMWKFNSCVRRSGTGARHGEEH